MKSLPFSLLLLLLGIIETLITFSTALNTITLNKPEVQFRLLHNKGVHSFTQHFTRKVKNINEQILSDNVVQQASTPMMREFKRNMTSFKEHYPFYKQLNLSSEAVVLFSNMATKYLFLENSTNKDVQYILNLLKKLHYDTLSHEYENTYVKFMTTELLPKFENYTRDKNATKFSKWMTILNKCKDYECFYYKLNDFDEDYLNQRNSLLEDIQYALLELQVFYANHANRTAYAMLKDASLTQLDETTKQQFTRNLKTFITEYNSNHEFIRIYDILRRFYMDVVLKFYDKPQNIPKKDQEVLKEIFEKQNYKEFLLEYKKKFNDFAERDLLKRFELFRKSLSQNQLTEQKDLLDWFNNFNSLTTLEDKHLAIDKLYTKFDNHI